ncbi:23S rRNA (uracil(747)-C(5))-methyltransferase RlmC [Pseudolysinimonas sp.]|uniref:23S rRNA (uracil(747)-C(5))-methyltransferase RlmC n=1 Tax=Pseudolysinimonas sp. TaxID=2680009 RepID=UPI003F805898
MQCDYFDAGVCRSCTLMGVPYATQLADKESATRALLAAWPDLDWMPAVPSPESGFRNKAKMVVGGTVAAPTLGILDEHRHGVDLRGCGICAHELHAAFPAIAAFIDRAAIPPYDVPARSGELKHVHVTVSPDGELMVRFVLRSTEALGRIRKHLPWLEERLPRAAVISVNLLPAHVALVEGEEEIVLTEREALPMRMRAGTLLLPPGGFFQTNTGVAQGLYDQARAWTDQIMPETAWDLYCGVGGFALHLAAPGRTVVGVEVSEAAIAGARAADVPGTSFIADDATAWAEAQTERPDLVVVNPPRRGLGERLDAWLEASGVPSVVYSSCNAVTLARDLAALPSYRPVAARMFDMFPQTAHVETMVLLSRRGS